MSYYANSLNSKGALRTNNVRGSVNRWNKVYLIAILLAASLAVVGGTLASIESGASVSRSNRPSGSSAQFQISSVASSNIREATGVDDAAIQPTVTLFRNDLGTLRPNTRSSFPNGRREITWDGVSDGASAPNNLPPDFFNTTSPRGVVFSTPGTGFQVSMDNDNPPDADPDQVRFANINSTYSSQFGAFSAQRLFTVLGSNVTDITFFVPGTNIPATVTGFGAVFTDVDNGGSTNIQFFDPDGNLLLVHDVLATAGSQSFSFLGISFSNGQRVSKVRITSGNSLLGPNDNPAAGIDVVAMDDFIYAEPQAAVCVPKTITGDLGQHSADYPSTSGIQSGRVSQNGAVSSCAVPKTCPGVIPGNSFEFDAYQFANSSNATACVTFNFPNSCGANQAIHPVAYLGSFDPANPCANYLGDIGHSINASETDTFSVNVPANSIVVLVVHKIGTVPGCPGYTFSVSGLPPCYQSQLPCPPATITGDIGQGSSNYPSTSGSQTGRVAQNGVNNSCASPKTCPGTLSPGSTFAFDAYQFANNSNATACVTFNFPNACGANQAIHPVAYLGSFDPANPCTNYLGDIGHSINASETDSFSVNAPANSVIVLVVHEIGTVPDCQGYTFSITGLPPCPPTGGCTLLCPTNIFTGNSAGQCGAVVSYPQPAISGQCGALTCTPPSGSFFPTGTTTVTCSAGSSTCSFTVTVIDTEPPTIACPANVSAVTSQSSCLVGPVPTTFTYPNPTVTDNCPGVTAAACHPPSGSLVPVGTTTVTCTATDAAGNSAHCSFSVTVFDVCLQDDSNPGTVLLINSTTGDYRFCCNGTVFSGRGTVSVRGCTISLQHNSLDRRVSANIDKTLFKGNALIQSPPGTTRCTISDRDIKNNSCNCG